jgi:TetR/AcrR family fatty acid metabolism transcriptional regulator
MTAQITPQHSKLCRKERERLRRECEILEAAEKVFSRRGFFAAQVSEIAREAEFSVGTLYSFFKSKDEIYKRIVEHKVGEFIQKYRQSVEKTADPLTQIERLIDTKIEYFLANKAFFRIYVSEFRGMGYSFQRELREGVTSLYEGYLSWLSEIFRRGTTCNVFIKVDPDALATAFEAVSNSALVRWLRSGNEGSTDQLASEIKRIFLNGVVLQGICRPEIDSIGREY